MTPSLYIPVYRYGGHRQQAHPDVSVSQKGHQHAQKANSGPARVDESDRVEWKHQQTENEVGNAETFQRNTKPNVNF